MLRVTYVAIGRVYEMRPNNICTYTVDRKRVTLYRIITLVSLETAMHTVQRATKMQNFILTVSPH